jgi:SET domain-containing protein
MKSASEDFVSILVRVGTSCIAGQGLFAAQNIKKDTRIIRYNGEKISKEESDRRATGGNAYIFQFNDRYDIDGKTLKNKARYVNHSCDPNCETFQTERAIWIIALRDIKEGEELTYNYGYGIEDYEQYPCTCRSKHCCGYILHPRYWERIKEQ